MNRIDKLNSFKEHAWYSRLYKKLKPTHIDFCTEFIEKNNNLNKDEFEKAVNRMFLDNTNGGINQQTKAERERMLICQELIATSNI